MPTSQNDTLSEDLAKSLEAATALMQDLLGDIKDNATSLAILQAKLESLHDNVESLSHIVRDGNGKGSMVTRLALIEKSVEDVEKSFDELKGELGNSLKEIKDSINEEKRTEKEDEDKEKEFKRQQMITKLKLIAVIAPGAIALAIVVIKLVMGIE
jgi:hypothetical protein